jgi:hypothetical protein
MEISMPAIDDIKEAIEAELKQLEARAASLRAALEHLTSANSPAFGDLVTAGTRSTKLSRETAIAKTGKKKAAPGKAPRKIVKPVAKAAAGKATRTNKVVVKGAAAKPARKAAKSASKVSAKAGTAGKKSVKPAGNEKGLPPTGAKFWTALLTAEPKVAKDILSAAKDSIGGKLSEEQTKALHARMGVYLSQLSHKGAIKSTKTDAGLGYSTA